MITTHFEHHKVEVTAESYCKKWWETCKSKILPKMQNTSSITLSVTQPSAAVFRYSMSAADTSGNQKIITDCSVARSTFCQGVKSSPEKSQKRANC